MWCTSINTSQVRLQRQQRRSHQSNSFTRRSGGNGMVQAPQSRGSESLSAGLDSELNCIWLTLSLYPKGSGKYLIRCNRIQSVPDTLLAHNLFLCKRL